jgi:hypothetical protein
MSWFFWLALETCDNPSTIDGWNFARGKPFMPLHFGTVPFRGNIRL